MLTNAGPDERRLRYFHLPYRELSRILVGRVKIVGPELPLDAAIVHVFDEFCRGGLVVVIESRAFDPIADGRPIPDQDRFSPLQLKSYDVAEDESRAKLLSSLRAFLDPDGRRPS